MTKKDYIKLTADLKIAWEYQKGPSHRYPSTWALARQQGFKDCVSVIEDALMKDNERFNRMAFRKAIFGEDDA